MNQLLSHIKMGATLLGSLCFLFVSFSSSAQNYKLRFYLSSRNCSNCNQYTKLLNKIPHYVPIEIATDVPMGSIEFDFFIDTVLEINKERFQFLHFKNMSIDLFNQVQILDNSGNLIYQNNILNISVDLDSVLQIWNYQILLSYKIKSQFPFLKGTIIRAYEDSSIFCYNYATDRLLHINYKTQAEFTYTPKQLSLFSIYLKIFSDSSKADNAMNVISQSDRVFKQIQIDNFLSYNDTIYLLCRVACPVLLSSESIEQKYKFINQYIIVSCYYGQIIELTPIVKELPLDSFYLTKDKYFIQSMSINGGIFSMQKDRTLLIGISNVSYSSQKQKYFAKFIKSGNTYIYEKKQIEIVNPHLIELKTILPATDIDDYSFSNFASLSNNFLYFNRQFMFYDLNKNNWIKLKLNNPRFDSVSTKPKGFTLQMHINTNFVKTLHYTHSDTQPILALNTFNKHGDFIQTDTITSFWKNTLARPCLTDNGIMVVDNDRVLRVYSYPDFNREIIKPVNNKTSK